MAKIQVLGRRNSMNVQKLMWALGELERDYVRIDVGGSFGFPEDYPEKNPNGLVPTLCDGEITVWESNACVRYVARRYGQGTLWPADERLLAEADQWMDWQASVLAPSFMPVFLNKVRLPADQANRSTLALGIESCARIFRGLDTHLSRAPYMVGDSLSMADLPLGPMAYRYLNMEIHRPDIPHVEAWYQRLAERPAYQHHVMIPFGRNAEEWMAEERLNAGLQ